MKLPNHLVGGILFAGLAGIIAGGNPFASPVGLLATTIGCLLPDIDLPKSIPGRLLPPLSRWINRRFGHRTLTHSAFALALSCLLLGCLEVALTHTYQLTRLFGYGFLSHLFLDMLTLQGVQLLYPFWRNPFVMPANPAWRVRTDDLRAETVYFCIFTVMLLALQPLFNQGFWTSYNRLWGTLKHLASEFRKSDDLLRAEYTIRQGSVTTTGAGLVIQATEKQAVLLQADSFFILSPEQMIIERVVPSHTGQRFGFQTVSFLGVSVDSLNQLLNSRLVTSLEILASQPLIRYGDPLQLPRTAFSLEYATHLFFAPAPLPLDTPRHDSVIFTPNPRINILRHQMTTLRNQISRDEQAWLAHTRRLDSLRQILLTEADLPARHRYYETYQRLLKVKAPTLPYDRLAALQVEIGELQYQESLRNLDRRLRSQHPEPAPPAPPSCTGVLTFLVLDPQ